MICLRMMTESIRDCFERNYLKSLKIKDCRKFERICFLPDGYIQTKVNICFRLNVPFIFAPLCY